MDSDKYQENTDEIPDEKALETPKVKSVGGKINKNGQPRKELSDMDKARRAEILAEGRKKALEKRKQLAEMKKTPPVTKPVPEPEPEPDVGKEKLESDDDEMLEVVRKQKKKKKAPKKKIIIVDESSSSSSEDEIVVKKKKKKRPPTPPPPPPTPTPPPFVIEKPKPSIPTVSEEELDKIRQDKIRRYNAKKKQEKLMQSIFGS